MYLNELSHAQAEALALDWVSSAPRAVRRLSQQFPSTVLDYSDASLRSLLQDSIDLFTFGPSAGPLQLPVWCEDTHYSGYLELGPESLWLVDSLALYLGDLLVSRDSAVLHWGVYCRDRPAHPWHHHPAVIGYRWPYSTFEDMAMFAVKAASGEPEDPQQVVSAINFYLSVFRTFPQAS